MNQSLDLREWPSIRFAGELLPQSVSGISIRIDRDFTERTGDWIWRLPHCKEVWKDGAAEWCIESATEIIDHLLEHRAEVIAEIQERLGTHGFDGPSTIDEWLTALARIRTLAASADEVCRWIAGEPTQKAEEALPSDSGVPRSSSPTRNMNKHNKSEQLTPASPRVSEDEGQPQP